jgi:hypothetical protein
MTGQRGPGGACPGALGLASRRSCGATFGERAVRGLAWQIRSGGSVPGVRDGLARFVSRGPSPTSSSDAGMGHLRDPPTSAVSKSVPRGLPVGRLGVPHCEFPSLGTGLPASESPRFAPHLLAHSEGTRRGRKATRPLHHCK